MTRGLLAGITVACLAIGAASAKTVRVTISNDNDLGGGLSLTPLYVAFHNGDFQAFNPGDVASAGIEELAEEGMFGALAGERQAATPDGVGGTTSQGGALTAPGGFGGAPVIEPGEQSTRDFVLDDGNNFFNFFSMVIPSNDPFIGAPGSGINLDDVDLTSGFEIVLTAANVWDAGTEVNNNNGAAFNADQGDPAFEFDENGVITLAGPTALNVLTGQTGANGLTIAGSPVPFQTTITISAVPLPAGAPLVLSGLFAFGWLRYRKNKA
ncbi:MAG: spondin domain-containing protein [Pseudomonadota bacterium]